MTSSSARWAVPSDVRKVSDLPLTHESSLGLRPYLSGHAVSTRALGHSPEEYLA
jgi:hypothetical protein